MIASEALALAHVDAGVLEDLVADAALEVLDAALEGAAGLDDGDAAGEADALGDEDGDVDGALDDAPSDDALPDDPPSDAPGFDDA